MNDAFLSLLGFERRDVIGHTAAELNFWGEPLDRIEMLRQLRDDKRVTKHHTRYRTSKGESREAEVWAESIELDGQPCVLAITRDVTEIRTTGSSVPSGPEDGGGRAFGCGRCA